MMSKLSKKTICLAAAAIALTGTLAVGSAYAYFTTYSEAKGNVVFQMGETRTEPHEEVKEGKKIVSIENTGDYDCYIRVKAYAGNNYNLSYADGGSGKWYDGGDGYWYYKDILEAGSTSETVLVNIPKELLEDITDEKDLNVIVIQECTPVQYDDNGEPYADWNVTFEDSRS